MADIKKQQELAAELSSKLWAMANDLRGNMEAYEFKNYILGLLFYKELSDRTEKFVAELLQEDNTTFEAAWKDAEYKEAIVDEMLIKLGYVLEPKYLFPEMLELIRKDEFSIDYFEEAINSIIASTQGQDSEADFDGLFEDMDLKSSKLGKEIKQRSKLIGKVLQTIDSIEVDLGDTDVDVLGTAYVILIGLFAQTAGKKGGEFYTPTNMSKLVARLATVGLTKVLNVADCACGSGSLLLQVGECVDVAKYYGQELTSSTYNLARMNMILHGIDYKNFSIINVDTLEDDTTFADEKYTIQVANPPYSTRWSADPKFMEDDRFSPYGKLAAKDKPDYCFLQHMIYHMDNGDSRIAILLPHGVLYRDKADETIRKYIITELNLLDAIIGLPMNCFHGTGIPVCCLVLKKERGENGNNICFIDASQYYFEGRNGNYLRDEDIDRIVNAYEERKNIDKFCQVVSLDTLKDNDYNCNISRYVNLYEAPNYPDMVSTKVKLESSESQFRSIISNMENFISTLDYDFAQDQEALYEALLTLKIRFKDKNGDPFPEPKRMKIGELYAERSTRGFEDMELLSVTMHNGVLRRSDLDAKDTSSEDKSKYKLVKPNDMVYNTMRMWQGANGVSKYEGIVSPAYTVMQPTVEIDTTWISHLFKLPEIVNEFRRYSQGMTPDTWNLKYSSIKDIYIPVPCFEEQKRIGEFLRMMDNIHEIKLLLENV